MKFSLKCTLLPLLFILASGSLRAQCCPAPGQPACLESVYYYFHGNMLRSSPNAHTTVHDNPWKKMGNIVKSVNDPDGSGTGVLIADKWVLTAAHVVSSGNKISFALARHGINCIPYGIVPAKNVYIPNEYLNNVGGSYNSQKTRAYDWALIELDRKPSAPGLPAVKPWSITGTPYVNVYKGETLRAAGYGCYAACRATIGAGKPLKTDNSGTFLNYKDYASSINNGGLIVHDLEGSGGMSGGPVWYYKSSNKKRYLLGVLVGSPQSACDNGKNWAAALSPGTQLRIIAVMNGANVPSMTKRVLPASQYISVAPVCNQL